MFEKMHDYPALIGALLFTACMAVLANGQAEELDPSSELVERGDETFDEKGPSADMMAREQASAAGTGARQLSIEDVIKITEDANLQILISRRAIREALFVQRQRRAALLPQVELNASQTRSKTALIGQGFGGRIEEPGASNRFDGRIAGRLSLFDANNYANLELAKLGYDIAELNLEEVRQDIFAAVARAYLTHRRNLARAEVIRSNIARAEQLLDLAQDQLAAGVATQIDVTRSEVELARDRRELLQQRTVIVESALNLKQLLDFDLDRAIELQEVYQRIREPRLAFHDDIDRILRERSEWRRAEQRLEEARLAEKAAGWQRIPNVSAFGDFGYADEEVFAGDRQEVWTVGVQLQIPIFEGGRIASEQRQAGEQVRARELQLRSLANELGAEIRLAIQDLRSRFDQIDIAEQEEQLSLEELRLARSRYEQGVADNRELIDAQNRVAAASDGLVEARFRYGLSRIQLARAAGDVRLIFEE